MRTKQCKAVWIGIAAAVLIMRGVPVVRADDAGGMRPGMWMGSAVELLVRPEDFERAVEILDTTALTRPEEQR